LVRLYLCDLHDDAAGFAAVVVAVVAVGFAVAVAAAVVVSVVAGYAVVVVVVELAAVVEHAGHGPAVDEFADAVEDDEVDSVEVYVVVAAAELYDADLVADD